MTTRLAADPLVMPIFGDGERKLAGVAVGIDCLTRHADLALALLTVEHGNQRHFAIMVELGKAGQQGGAQLTREIRNVANGQADARLVSALEGG